jgi:hypothetical protein
LQLSEDVSRERLYADSHTATTMHALQPMAPEISDPHHRLAKILPASLLASAASRLA